ncbi:MAG: WecB/TagA/CpsF family glycosyltransferase [Candidatus Nanopelagicales bacterium]|nr:WecB/TagA/CpsF family glycosyltransferase [Candidatus Nanopelagicales bacterium]
MTNAILKLPRAEVGRVPFRVAPLSQVLSAVLDASQDTGPSRRGTAVHFVPAYTVALADTDTQYAGVFRNTESAVFSDGVPVVWAGRRLHRQLAGRWERVYGPDVMEAVLAASTSEGPRHYLLGGSPRTVETLHSIIRERFPQASVVGVESPPFRPLSQEEILAQDQRIAASGAQIVWVGLGTPKQDWEVARLAESLPVVAMAVGAAFDFMAGTKPQAPEWLRASGLEWAYRLGTEPKRLWRRYLWGNPRFLIAAARTPRQSRTRRR